MKIKISTWSDNSSTWIFQRYDEVQDMEEDDKYYYITDLDGHRWTELPKDSLFDKSYKIEVVEGSRKFTKYPVMAANTPSKACYIDNYSKWNKPYNTLENILDMANRCLAGTGLSVPGIDAIVIADNGQLIGFYQLARTASGNEYTIGWQDGEWKLFIYDNLPAKTLRELADMLGRFNETFSGVKFHEDRPLL